MFQILISYVIAKETVIGSNPHLMVSFLGFSDGSTVIQRIHTSESVSPIFCGNVHTADTHCGCCIYAFAVWRDGQAGNVIVYKMIDLAVSI